MSGALTVLVYTSTAVEVYYGVEEIKVVYYEDHTYELDTRAGGPVKLHDVVKMEAIPSGD